MPNKYSLAGFPRGTYYIIHAITFESTSRNYLILIDGPYFSLINLCIPTNNNKSKLFEQKTTIENHPQGKKLSREGYFKMGMKSDIP